MMKLKKKMTKNQTQTQKTTDTKEWKASTTMDLKPLKKWTSIFQRKTPKKPPPSISQMLHPPPTKTSEVSSTPNILNLFRLKVLNRSTTGPRKNGLLSLRMGRKQGVGRRLSKRSRIGGNVG